MKHRHFLTDSISSSSASHISLGILLHMANGLTFAHAWASARCSLSPQPLILFGCTLYWVVALLHFTVPQLDVASLIPDYHFILNGSNSLQNLSVPDDCKHTDISFSPEWQDWTQSDVFHCQRDWIEFWYSPGLGSSPSSPVGMLQMKLVFIFSLSSCPMCCVDVGVSSAVLGWGLVGRSSPPSPLPSCSSSSQGCLWPPAATKPSAPAMSASVLSRWAQWSANSHSQPLCHLVIPPSFLRKSWLLFLMLYTMWILVVQTENLELF